MERDFPPAWTPPGRVFVNLSGGLDSTYGLWHALSRGLDVVVHHCHMRNREGRFRVEHNATSQVLAWLKANGLSRWTLVESGFDYRTLPFIIYDVELIGWITGMALRSKRLQDVTTVMVTANAEDPSVRNVDSRRGIIRREAAEMAAYRKLSWWWPLRDMTKADIVRALPPELMALTWWCRRPDPLGRPCGKCIPCGQMERARVDQ